MSKVFPETTKTFQWLYILFSGWLVAGLYTDGWAHKFVGPELETFFSPWHAVLYSGFLAIFILLIITGLNNHRKGFTYIKSLPPAYWLAFLGGAFFLLSGFGDMIWHLIFGIEESLDALLSPTHLMLAVGGSLLVLGPFISFSKLKTKSKNLIEQLPAVISITYFLSILTFFTEYFHPFIQPYAAASYRLPNLIGKIPGLPHEPLFFAAEIMAIGPIILQTIILMGIVFLLVKRWKLASGSLTVLFTINAIFLAIIGRQYQLIPAMILAGISADLLLKYVYKKNSPLRFRIFSFSVPFLLYSFYFITLTIVDSLWITVHFWTGSIFIAGILGWLISHLTTTSNI